MCNFVIRPIRSFATVDITLADGTKIKRGDSLDVTHIEDGKVNGIITFDTFTHSFTADPADIKKVKEEEAKWFKPAKESK